MKDKVEDPDNSCNFKPASAKWRIGNRQQDGKKQDKPDQY
jgi:hypothetical protein